MLRVVRLSTIVRELQQKGILHSYNNVLNLHCLPFARSRRAIPSAGRLLFSFSIFYFLSELVNNFYSLKLCSRCGGGSSAREINCRENPAKVIAVLTSNLRLSCTRTAPRCIAHDFDSREFRFLFSAARGKNECVRLERKENKNEEFFGSFFGIATQFIPTTRQ